MRGWHKACAAGLAFALACGRDPIPASATDALVIGVATALSGDLQVIGATEQNATRVAEAHINACGGILGRPVVFQIKDDETSVAGFNKALDELLPMRPAALLGPTNSPQALDGQGRVAQAGILQISASASTPTMTSKQVPADRTFFRTAASHILQARAMAILAIDGRAELAMPKCTRAAVFHNDDDYGTPIALGIDKFMRERGGSVVLDIPTPSAAKGNYDEEAQRVVLLAAAGNLDCQILVTFPPAGATYMLAFKKAIEGNMSRDWAQFTTVGSNGVFQQPFLERSRTGSDPLSTRAEGVVGMQGESNPPTPQYNDFKNLYVAHYPQAAALAELPAYASNQFDGAILLALAMQRAGTTTDLQKIRAALFDVSRPPGASFGPARLSEALAAIRRGEDIDYEGASGAVDFDENGDVITDFILWKVEGGKFKTDPKWRITADKLR